MTCGKSEAKDGARPINLIPGYPETGIFMVHAQRQQFGVRVGCADHVRERGQSHQWVFATCTRSASYLDSPLSLGMMQPLIMIDDRWTDLAREYTGENPW